MADVLVMVMIVPVTVVLLVSCLPWQLALYPMAMVSVAVFLVAVAAR